MDPAIRYTNTADGVRIAYWEQGEGQPLVLLDVPCFSHVEIEMRIPDYRAWHSRLAASTRLIRLDLRGSGLSQRDVGTVTIGTFEADIEAVLAATGVSQAALFARSASAPVALQMAARRPDLVSHLFIYDGWADGEHLPIHNALRELDRLIEVDWPMYTEMVAKVMMEREGAQARAVAAFLRRCSTPADWRTVAVAARSFDATADLPLINCPTVVMHSGANRLAPASQSRQLAAAIRGCELRMFNHAPLPAGGVDEVAEVIEAALGIEPRSRRRSPQGLQLIVFTDIEGHSRLVDRLGDDEARGLLREHERVTRRALREFDGQEIKALGDGFMAAFSSVQQALDCAAALQRSIASSPILAPQHLRVRVGINAGEPIAEEGDLFGTSVIAAARIAGKATGGQVLVANVVRELAAGKGFTFEDLGETSLRGLSSPIRLWALEWGQAAPAEE
ncbi:MAG: alpha/beta fold hydrolase [Dehalococcoidia bacterium]